MDVPTPGGIAASLPIKESYMLPIHVQTNPSVAETSTCNTIETSQADDQEWTNDITEYLRTGTLPEIPNKHTRSGCKPPFHLIGGTCTSDPSQDPTFGGALAHRAHSQGYYWPTMKKDAAAYALALRTVGHGHSGTPPSRTCPEEISARPTDYFSKWVKLKHMLASKTKMSPNSATNKTLITALKKRLEQAKGKWVEELPGILWAYRTTPGRPIGNTPFALAYGMDAIPTEIGLPTIRTEAAKQDDAMQS
ncbi:hypothetical protein CK203_096347 [Vitis vinifera]|uniref:Integrase zinc-binding domain-containing protein n=1 Tax=Vitis vinifera TaxID=29760 RepID=A0A438F4L0_VITVI|nr:hypothetical protein CK203_096347 [Vitis vinifera]